MGSICWLLLAIVNADVLELKVDDELAVQARAEFAKFDQKIAPADAVLDWAERSAYSCLLYTSPSPRDQRGSRMPSSA